MAITLEQFRQVFTQALVAVYRERIRPTGFLRSFFPDQTNMTKYISIEVERGSEKIAVDVDRGGSDGNANQMSRSTQKIIEPPLYWEKIMATDHYLYQQVVGGGTNIPNLFRQLVRELADEQVKLREKMERAYELQAAQVLQDGVVQLKNGDNIDFRRKAASLADISSSNPWSTSTNDPREILEDAGKFLRQDGKVQGGTLNAIMGEESLKNFLASDFVEKYGNLRRVDLMTINRPQRTAAGGVLHGEISAGPYNVRIWSYPEFYVDENGVMQPYINKDKVVVVPDNPQFLTGFGAVPQILDDNGGTPQEGAYLTFDSIDQKAAQHEIHTKSAGVTVPVAVDQLYTVKTQ